MSYIVSGCENGRVFEIFEDLCSIPHGSGNESGVADYIEGFVRNLGLEPLRDEVGNVFVRKGAAAGYENEPALLLQGHMDMVCEKDADSEHNFERDGLKLFVENGLLGARGTSLGGDNGIAVAMMLNLLTTDKHPTLECLFTVEEETGLAGAKGFDCSNITAKRMINLDSEQEDTVTAGCAGGVRTEVVFECEPVDLSGNPRDGYVIEISGLAGGHSGADINTGRANACVLLGRILARCAREDNIWLCELSGGGKDNAIARSAKARIICDDKERFYASATDEAEKIRRELSSDDSGFDVKLNHVSSEICFTLQETKKILGFMSLVRTGVLKMSNDISGLVEYSRNLGVAETLEHDIKFTLSSRSSLESQIDASICELDTLTELCGGTARHYSRYPGWEYSPVSPLRKEYLSLYEEMFGESPNVVVIHAGLECGIISSKTPELDIISIGPNMYDIHSPAERLSIASSEKIYKILQTFVSRKEEK